VVRKPGGPWAGSVLALLRHLEDVGFAGAPRVVGNGLDADGRVTLTYVPGESAHPHAWAEEHVGRVGDLLRRLHDATATFTPPPDAGWHPYWLRELGGDDVVIGHGDAAPWNIVGRCGAPEALVDWEYAGPVDRLTELAYAAWLNAQLHDDDVAELQGLPDATTRARHFRAVLDGYGLPAARRAEVVDRMIEVAVHAARAEAVLAGVTPDSTDAVATDGYPVLWAITWRARSASWMLRHRALLLG
jgi:Ser/Thr protein kinase RdoA (MazF antagonist)